MTLLLKLRLDPNYVDRMEFFECIAAMNHMEYAVRDGWEQARLIAYMVAQVNSTKKLKPKDIIEFAWDHKVSKQDAEYVSNANADRLRSMAAAMAAEMSDKNTSV